MVKKSVTRRDFLKLTGIGLGGTVLACSGLGYAATRTPEFESHAITYGKETSMNKKILITYATRAGSTPEIAAAIGEVIAARGFSVEVKPVKENPVLEGYQAVIMGSAIRMGAWLPEAMKFVQANQSALSRVPCALFTAHMLNTGEDEASRQARQATTAEVRKLIPVQGEVFFSGKIELSKLSFLDRLLAKAVAKDTGVVEADLRDWDRIRGWAQTVFA